MVDSMEKASVADTADTAWVRNRTSIVISSATSVSGGSASPGLIRSTTSSMPACTSSPLIWSMIGAICSWRSMSLPGCDAVLADVVERLNELGPHDDRLAVLEADDAEPRIASPIWAIARVQQSKR